MGSESSTKAPRKETVSKTLTPKSMDAMKQAETDYGLSLLASTLAHEIRNPLQTIRLQMEMVQRGASLEGAVECISENVNRLEAVVNRVQQLSQRYILHPEKINLREILDSTLATMNFWLSASGIRVGSHIQWEGEAFVECDRELLQQVLLNLCMNAIQAMPAGGQLSVSIFEEIDFAVFEVEDTGEGMTPETLKVAGTPFFTTKSTGSGLGLAFCKTIASLHGGSIEIESKKGKGTKVTLRALKAPATTSKSNGRFEEKSYV